MIIKLLSDSKTIFDNEDTTLFETTVLIENRELTIQYTDSVRGTNITIKDLHKMPIEVDAIDDFLKENIKFLENTFMGQGKKDESILLESK